MPTLGGKLADNNAGPVAKYVFQSLPSDVQQGIRDTARLRFDKLSQDDKRAICIALNDVISKADVIPAAELENIKVKTSSGLSLTYADVLRVKRRVYVENLFPKELAKAHGPGRAMRWMTPQSIAHLVLIVAIIFGNICYFIERARRRKAQAGA